MEINESKKMINNLMRRRDALNFCSGRISALKDIIFKKEQALMLELKGEGISHFVNAEAKAALHEAQETFEKLKTMYDKEI